MSTVGQALLEATRVAGTAPGVSDPGELAGRLYAQWYAAPVTPAREPVGPPLARLLDARLLAVGGWRAVTVRRLDPGGGLVVRDPGGRHHAVLPGRWTRPSDPGETARTRTSLPPREGQQVLVPPVGGPVLTDSWWRTWATGWVHPAPPGPLTRVYLCPRLDHLVHVVGRAVEALVPLRGAWLLKCAVDDAALARPDRVVVYVPDPAAPAALAALEDATRGWLEPHTPPLTRVHAPGLGWAQDDGDGASFGENRCAALARGLTAWQQAGRPQEAEPMARRALREAGLDDRRPHLRRAGSAS
ncbi:T3SS effector HopA1 family protein [uncultured Serinicoccus sp.]|uniref:T3SS effector HopA1 family protein n=1 Tax=uncultured Serinicoccus sp. TaxID=735514 RepID=UPI002625E1B8|nr:T3SS effector HopA1 family protein [uncultured Serinicoccus sp.]